MMQTPKTKPTENFTSPIGLLKKYSSTNAQNAQFSHHSKNNSYEEEFFKIKAERLDADLQDYKEQNSILRAKVADYAANIQILKEKVYTLENLSPVKNSQPQRQRSSVNSEIERLLKEIRVIKNEHEVQMTKTRDQNRKLQKKNLELIECANKSIQQEQQYRISNVKHRQDADSRLQEQNMKLRQDIDQYISEKSKSEQKMKKIFEEARKAKNQNEELNAIISGQSRYEEKYNDLLSKYESQSKQLQEVLKDNREFLQTKAEQNKNHNASEVYRSAKTSRYQEEDQNSYELKNRVRLLELKVEQQQSVVIEKNGQIKNILEKLKPLLSRDVKGQKEEKEDISKRANLTMLEIFLKKYKITTF